MSRLTGSESRELQSLERRVEVALEVASNAGPPAPPELCEMLVDALARLRALESGSADRPRAVECVERGLAALHAWERWKPAGQTSA